MKRSELESKLESELEHIPRCLRGSYQNELRLFYNGMRRNDLAKDVPEGKAKILRKAIQYLKKGYPDFVPRFDKNFFFKIPGGEKTCLENWDPL